MYIYNRSKIERTLIKNRRLQDILSLASSQKNTPCPYDKIVICSNRSPRPKLLTSVDSSKVWQRPTSTYNTYLNKISCKYFTLTWGPIRPNFPETIITINPSKQKYNAVQILFLVEFLIDSYFNARIMRFDAKVDIPNVSPSEIIQRLYAGYKRNAPHDYRLKHETYYFGKRNGQQIKVYDKAAEQNDAQVILTRIEKTKKYSVSKRPLLLGFLSSPQDDAFQHMTVLDIDLFNNRDKIRRRINKWGSFQIAYSTLNNKEKNKIKQHDAFTNPWLDLQAIFQEDLRKWLGLTPNFCSSYTAVSKHQPNTMLNLARQGRATASAFQP